jgi:thiol-disulfide isomerase/thioredoxin
MERGIRLNVKSSLPPLAPLKHQLNLNEDLFVETSKSILLESPLTTVSTLPTLATKPVSFESLQPTSLPSTSSPALLKPTPLLMPTKMEETEKVFVPSKTTMPTVPEKKELNFLLNKNKINKTIKNSEFYKYFLYFLALIVMLYLTRNYWWKYVTKKFFPSEEKKDELKALEKDLTGSDVDFFDVSNVKEVIELEDKDALHVKKPAPYAKVLLIYANWCGHCKDMMKAYEDAARVRDYMAKNKIKRIK